MVSWGLESLATKGRCIPLKDSIDSTRNARFRGVAVLTAVTLATAPMGFGGLAYGAGPGAEIEAGVPEENAASEQISRTVPVESVEPEADAEVEAPADEAAPDTETTSEGEAAPDAEANPDAGTMPDGETSPDGGAVAPDGETVPDDGLAPDEGATPDDAAPDDETAPDGTAPDDNATPDDDGTVPDGSAGDDPVDPVDPDADEPNDADDPSADQPDADAPVVPVIPEPVEPQPVAPPAVMPDSAFASPSVSAAASPRVATPSSGTYTPRHYSHNLTTEKFIAVVGEQARQVGQDRDLYASVMIAQAILESASGNSALAQAPNNNLFGIKGSWKGKSVSMHTMEDDGSGLYFAIIANFRAYDSITDSLEDYADLLTDGMGGYYRGAWKSNAATPAQACDFLQGRYATSTSYSASLQDLIATYNLTRFDEPLDFQTVETYELPAVDEETGQALLDEAGNPVLEARTLADLVAEATSHLGTEYVWGGADPKTGFDCSSLVQYAYREALGVDLPRTTYQQWKLGTTVSFDDLRMGDLLFFERDGDVHHVALYLGDGYYIHAPQTGDVVKVTSMEEYAPSFAQRIVETRPVEDEAGGDGGEFAANAQAAGADAPVAADQA